MAPKKGGICAPQSQAAELEPVKPFPGRGGARGGFYSIIRGRGRRAVGRGDRPGSQGWCWANAALWDEHFAKKPPELGCAEGSRPAAGD